MMSKSPLLPRVLLCALIVMLGALSIDAQTDLTGFWVFKAPRGDGTFNESYFELKQSGETITGNTVGGRVQSPVNEGACRDGKLHFAVSFTGRSGQKGGAPQTFTTIYEGTLQGDKLAMTITGGRGARVGRGPITGEFERTTAQAAMPPAKLPLPELHDVRDNKLARTPPMGWNSWNKFAGAIDDKAVRSIADTMASSGMKKAGYVYVNIDDTWAVGGDAKTFAAWGIDYLKYDWCSAGTIYTDEDMQPVYQKMGDALLKSGRPILYSLCQYGNNKVWEWGAKVGGNCWRTTGDINDSWQSLDRIGFGPAVPGGIRKQGEPATAGPK